MKYKLKKITNKFQIKKRLNYLVVLNFILGYNLFPSLLEVVKWYLSIVFYSISFSKHWFFNFGHDFELLFLLIHNVKLVLLDLLIWKFWNQLMFKPKRDMNMVKILWKVRLDKPFFSWFWEIFQFFCCSCYTLAIFISFVFLLCSNISWVSWFLYK